MLSIEIHKVLPPRVDEAGLLLAFVCLETARQMRLAVFPIRKFSIQIVLIVFKSKNFDLNSIKGIRIEFRFE